MESNLVCVVSATALSKKVMVTSSQIPESESDKLLGESEKLSDAETLSEREAERDEDKLVLFEKEFEYDSESDRLADSELEFDKDSEWEKLALLDGLALFEKESDKEFE